MIKIIEKEGSIFIAEASEMVTKEDIESIIPMFEKMITEHEKIKCLIIINELKGYTLEGFLADFSFYFKHKNAFSYMALVGNQKFEKAMTNILNIFYPDRTKYFDSSEFDKAKAWIKQA